MTRNSNKNGVLERRRVELLHAVKHDADTAAIAKRVESLKQAVFGVAKKHHVRNHPFTHFSDNHEWRIAVEYWESLAPETVVEIVMSWGELPAYREVWAAARQAVASSRDDE